jgi:hypothetical protein
MLHQNDKGGFNEDEPSTLPDNRTESTSTIEDDKESVENEAHNAVQRRLLSSGLLSFLKCKCRYLLACMVVMVVILVWIPFIFIVVFGTVGPLFIFYALCFHHTFLVAMNQ